VKSLSTKARSYALPAYEALVRKTGCIQQVGATLPKLNRFIQGGVYDTRETGGGFGGAADRHLAALEGGRVVA
jgi:hypothetical protein